FFSPERARDAFGYEPLDGFEIVPTVHVVLSDDVGAARDVLRPMLALYIGGMRSGGADFYNALGRRVAYESESERVQERSRDGTRRADIAAAPAAQLAGGAPVAPAGRTRARLDAWREAGVTTLLVGTADVGTLRAMAELA